MGIGRTVPWAWLESWLPRASRWRQWLASMSDSSRKTPGSSTVRGRGAGTLVFAFVGRLLVGSLLCLTILSATAMPALALPGTYHRHVLATTSRYAPEANSGVWVEQGELVTVDASGIAYFYMWDEAFLGKTPDGDPWSAGEGFSAPLMRPYSLVGELPYQMDFENPQYQLGSHGSFVALTSGYLGLYPNNQWGWEEGAEGYWDITVTVGSVGPGSIDVTSPASGSRYVAIPQGTIPDDLGGNGSSQFAVGDFEAPGAMPIRWSAQGVTGSVHVKVEVDGHEYDLGDYAASSGATGVSWSTPRGSYSKSIRVQNAYVHVTSINDPTVQGYSEDFSVVPWGSILETWNGLDVFNNFPRLIDDSRFAATSAGMTGWPYQCAELAQRWFWPAYPHKWGVNASGMFDTAAGLGFEAVPNGESPGPEPGDLVVYSYTAGSGSIGHVSVVTAVQSSKVTIAEQNWSLTGQAELNYLNGQVTDPRDGTSTIKGWVKHEDVPPPPTDHLVSTFIVGGFNGSVEPAGPKQVADGDSLTISIQPNLGYKIDSVTDNGVNVISQVTGLFAPLGGTYTIPSVVEDHYIEVRFAPWLSWPFWDIESSPYRDAIAALAADGVIGGYPDNSFRPLNPVLRAQFAKMIVLGLGLPVSEADVCPFGDVEVSGLGGLQLDNLSDVSAFGRIEQSAPSGDPLYPDHYVAVAAANGITYGVVPGIFGPYLDITRAQLITMVVRAAERLMPGVVQTSLLPAAIYDAGPHTENIQKAAASGLLDGLVGYGDLGWDPWTGASRGEVAQILYNLRGHEGQDSSIPSAPTNLAAVALSSSSIRFTWADVSNETGYIIMQGGVTASWTEVGRTAANVTSFTNTGLMPSKDYFYTVVAYNSAGTTWSADYVYATTLTSGYTVGGTGPAGGIVFYDKGSYSDGWRYLEAAPVSTEWPLSANIT